MIEAGSSPRISLRSAPAENTLGPPVKITHGASRSSGRSRASHSSRSIWPVIAFSLGSRVRVTTHACSLTSRATVSDMGDRLLRHGGAELQHRVKAALAGLVGDDQPLDLGRALPDPVDTDV